MNNVVLRIALMAVMLVSSGGMGLVLSKSDLASRQFVVFIVLFVVNIITIQALIVLK